MHPNLTFRNTPEERSIELVRAVSFGSLLTNGDPVPIVAHVPFLLSDTADYVDLHLVRSNPIARQCTASIDAKLSIIGPDGYISPDWYGLDDQVPTWNYVAVHLTGTLERLPQTELLSVIDALSDHFEQQLTPKPIWKTRKVDPAALDKMMRMIVPFRLHITQIDSTWKLGQNKPDAARLAAAKHLRTAQMNTHANLLADFMDSPPAAD